MKTRDYLYNPCDNTITITKAFAEKLQNPNSEESKIYRAIKADNPTIVTVQRTHKTKSGHVNQNKRLTYDNMVAFMELLPNAEEYLTAFNNLLRCANLVCLSPYTAVRNWFMDQFPLYRRDPLFYLTNVISVIPYDKYLDEEKEAV